MSHRVLAWNARFSRVAAPGRVRSWSSQPARTALARLLFVGVDGGQRLVFTGLHRVAANVIGGANGDDRFQLQIRRPGTWPPMGRQVNIARKKNLLVDTERPNRLAVVRVVQQLPAKAVQVEDFASEAEPKM